MPTIWPRLLERLASGDPIVGIDELRRWGRVEFERAVGLGIFRETEPARLIMCDACPERHWSEVITVAGGRRMFISCPEEGTVNVEPRRLQQWRIDAGRVAELAAGALGLPAPVEVLLLQHLWRLGRRRVGGRYRDIFLGVGGGPPLQEMSVAIRRSIGQGSALLLSIDCDGNQDGLAAGHQAVDFLSISRLDGSQIIVDLEYLEDRFAESTPPSRKSLTSIPARTGAGWADVSVIVFDEFLRITIAGKDHEVGFAEMGIEPEAQPAELLKLFAAARGTLDAAKIRGVVSGESPIKMRILRLRQLLQELIEVDGDPITYHKKARTYSCRFQIRLDRDEGFRAPSGASWLDVAFHERTDGRILVTVAEKHKFRAHGSHRDEEQPNTEVAERDGTTTEVHSLEEIKLRSQAGRLTEEGALFLHLLRAGAIPRDGNDMVVLSLAKCLREWTGLDGDPLRLVESSRSWTAFFACSSELKPMSKKQMLLRAEPQPTKSL